MQGERILFTTTKAKVEENRFFIIPTHFEPKPKQDNMSIMNVESTQSQALSKSILSKRDLFLDSLSDPLNDF